MKYDEKRTAIRSKAVRPETGQTRRTRMVDRNLDREITQGGYVPSRTAPAAERGNPLPPDPGEEL